MECGVVACEGEACGGRVERDDLSSTKPKTEAKRYHTANGQKRKRVSAHDDINHEEEWHRTAFAGPRKGDRVATDAAECVEDDVAPTAFCYLRRYRLGRDAVPPLLVQ